MGALSLSLPCLYPTGTSITAPGFSCCYVIQGPICRLWSVREQLQLDPQTQRHASYYVRLLIQASEGYRLDSGMHLTLFWQPPLTIADQVWWFRAVGVKASSLTTRSTPQVLKAVPLASSQR